MESWLDLKPGDEALSVHCAGEHSEHAHPCIVKTVGRKYITVLLSRNHTQRFDIETGYGEYGYSLHTKESLHDYSSRRAFRAVIREGLANPQTFSQVPISALAALALALDESRNEE